MTFTDEDLKRLKKTCTKHPAMVITCGYGEPSVHAEALLVRLEAAENAIFPILDLLGILEEFTELDWGKEGPPVNADEFIEKANTAMEAWRRAAGK